LVTPERTADGRPTDLASLVLCKGMAARNPVDFTNEAELAVAMRIGRAWRELRRGAAMGKLRDSLTMAGGDMLEPGQIDSLDLLVQRPEWRMSELADALRVDPSTATRAVQRLERIGLAQRQPCGGDGRVVMVSATELGQARHDVFASARRNLLGSLLQEFEPEERAELASHLDRFVTALDRYVDQL
jgi:DNA-binding MarR family transcriptional regulator